MKKHLSFVPITLLIILMLFSATMYFTQSTRIIAAYTAMGFPAWVMYFNGICKILGAGILLSPVGSKQIKDYAFAGYLYILVLALLAHVMVNDGQAIGSIIGLVLWVAAFGVKKTSWYLN